MHYNIQTDVQLALCGNIPHLVDIRNHRREKNESGLTRRVHVAEKGSGNSRADIDEAIANETDS